MEFVLCNIFAAKQWPAKYQPFHLVTDNVKWVTQMGKSDSPITISLSTTNFSNEFPPKPGLFCQLYLDNCPGDALTSVKSKFPNQQHSTLDFYCSKEFFQHYGAILPTHGSFYFTCVRTFPLERVILAAITDDTFQWAKQQNFETGLLVSTTCSKSLLIRQNDCFLSSFHHMFGHDQNEVLQRFKNLVVLECSPLKQGVLSSNTAISIVKMEDIHNKLVQGNASSMHSKLGATVKGFSDSVNVGVFDFKSILERISSTVMCSNTLATSLGLKGEIIVEVSLAKLLETKKDSEKLRSSDRQNESAYLQIDTEDCEVRRCLVGTARVCFLKVIPDVEYCRHASRRTSMILCGQNTTCNQCLHTVTFTSDLWFNFHNVSNDIPLEFSCYDVELRKVKQQPTFAREVHMSLVRSPCYSASSCFDKTLINFLTDRRLLRIGDVVPIDVYDDIDFYEAADANSCRSRQVYYKVSKFDDSANPDNCYFVDIKRTTLYQDGTVGSYIPSMACWDSAAESQHLSGLEQYTTRLRNVISPYLHSKRVLDHLCTVLVSGRDGSGKWSVVSHTCQSLNLHLIHVDCYGLTGDTAGASEAKIKDTFRRAAQVAPCALLLSGIDRLGRNRDSGQADIRVCRALAQLMDNFFRPAPDDASHPTFPVVVIATTDDRSNVVGDIRSHFLHQINLDAPGESERYSIIKGIARSLDMSRDVDHRWIAKHTAGFVYGDMWELFRKTLRVAHSRIVDKCAVGTKLTWNEEKCVCMAGVISCQADMVQALHQMQSERADSIGVPKIPDVKWNDIGGLEEVKNHILDTIQLPLDHPELVASGLRRSGVLLYGPPGTGKTLLAKAVASQCSLSFLSVKGPELINMYVGQSEENVRKVFQRARDAAPCVIFFDELDALAPNRGRSGDSGGVMDRVVSQLLAELDGMNEAGDEDKQVFVIAASNRPDLIDSALLRPGRLDKLLYVGVSESKSDRLKILQAQTRKLKLSAEVCLSDVIDECPANITGADFYALTSEAAMNAVRRHIRRLEAGDVADNEIACEVEQEDFLKAASNIVPSVSQDQLLNYKRVKTQMAR